MKVENKPIFVNMNSSISKKVSKKMIFGSLHLVIEGCGSIPADSVLNGILYKEDELIRLADDTVGYIHAPSGHTYSSNGEGISASSPEGIHQGYIGAVSFNYRYHKKMLIRDIAIDIEKAKHTEDGVAFIDAINSGDDVDTSTGLLLVLEESDGFGKDGEPYYAIARNIELDHDAILLNEVGAATSDQGVGAGIFTNKKGVSMGVVESKFNASIPAVNMPISDSDFNESEAIERIKAYSDSVDAPSVNYRRFFLEFDRDDVDNFDGYKKLFADIINIDGADVPHAMVQALDKYMDDDFVVSDERASGAVKKYLEEYANNSVDNDGSLSYNELEIDSDDHNGHQINNDKGFCMNELIIKALEAAGVSTEGLDDAQLLAAYDKLGEEKSDDTDEQEEDNMDKEHGNNSEKDIESLIANAVAKAVNPLLSEVQTLKNNAIKADESERNELAEAVDKLNIGIDKESAILLGNAKLKDILAKNGGSVQFNALVGDEVTDQDYDIPEY